MQLDDPIHFDSRGRTSTTSEEEHIRDLIEQVLFTSPGERVNRPDFGSGVLKLLFAPLGDSMAAAAQHTVQSALQQWLGELIQVEGVDVSSEDSSLRVTVRYLIRRSQQREVRQFVRGDI